MKHLLWRRFAHTGERKRLQPPRPRIAVAFSDLDCAKTAAAFVAAMTSLSVESRVGGLDQGSGPYRLAGLRKLDIDHSLCGSISNGQSNGAWHSKDSYLIYRLELRERLVFGDELTSLNPPSNRV